MTWWLKALYILAGGVVFGALIFWMGRCSASDPPSDFGPAVIDTVEVIKYLPDTSPSLGERLSLRRVDATAGGEAILTPSEGDFASAAARTRDSTLPVSVRDTLTPVYPLLRIETRAERGLKLGIERSDGIYVVKDYNCKHPCRVDAQGDTILVREHRQIPGFEFLKDLPLCIGAGALGAGIAWAASAPEPLAIGAAAGASCVVVKVAF